jgi:hypothetical protein
VSAVEPDPRLGGSFLDVKQSNFRIDPFEQGAARNGRSALIGWFMHVSSLRQYNFIPNFMG